MLSSLGFKTPKRYSYVVFFNIKTSGGAVDAAKNMQLRTFSKLQFHKLLKNYFTALKNHLEVRRARKNPLVSVGLTRLLLRNGCFKRSRTTIALRSGYKPKTERWRSRSKSWHSSTSLFLKTYCPSFQTNRLRY